MKPFRFALEKVLSWRRTKLAMEESSLERLQGDLRRIEAAMGELARRDEAETGRIRGMRSASGSDLAELARVREWIARQEKTLHSRGLECERQIKKQFEAVTEARRKVELVERLKERRRQTWDAEFDRELEQLAGESALGMWRREKGRSSLDA